jgi:murein L,D-transpeptidase YcbB/YkuD
MERWRWIPKDFGQDFLMVNIPEYTLRVYEKGKQAMKMKVIVGKTMNSTPIFSDKLEYVVLAPYWNVPFNIVKEEYAEKFANDPSLVEQLNMEVVDAKENPIDPASVDWMSLDESSFKYILRKRPGPKNDLGNVKFIFPNKNNVYLHDTPHDELFSQEKRGFSHGCVRVEKPIELAEYLLRKIPGWNRSQIMSTIAQNEEKFISLKQKLPVYLVYFTAWADNAGNVHFREDIYGHDRGLINKYFAKL